MKEVLITSSVLILALLALRGIFRKTISRRVQYRESMVMTVFFDQPVSPRRAAVSSVMVRGEASQSLFMSFHSPSDRCTFMADSSLKHNLGLVLSVMI